jgi:SAM-dependent methyltransferase
LGEQTSYRIDDTPDATQREHARLLALARSRDPQTIRVLSQLGIGRGWRCLEVGAGSGSISRWLAEQVGTDGQVLSVDIDLRFHCDPLPAMQVQRVDVVHDGLPQRAFDLVHARAVLEHIPEREAVLDRFVAATRPGGWIVVEDGDWQAFEAQPLPEPLAAVARAMHAGLRARSTWDPLLGSRLLRMFADRGLTDLDITGETRLMRGGDESGSWWYLGIEHAADRLVEHGLVTRSQIDGTLALVRSRDFVMMSPLSISVRGRVPV